MGAVEFFWGAEASSFCGHPTPQPPTPKGQGGSKRGVKRCATGKARRFAQRGIDPGFKYLEGGNPLLDAGRVVNSAQSLGRLGAYLIRRRLCGGGLEGLLICSDDQFLSSGFGRLPLAPGGRGASRSEGERGPPGAPKSISHLRRFPSTFGRLVQLGTRGALQSSGVRARQSAANSTRRLRLSPLPLDWYSPEQEGGGWEGVNRPSIPGFVNAISPAVHTRRPHHG